MKKKGERKQRSDKKIDVKPTIKIDLKDAIYELSYITYTPVKDVCAEMVRYKLKDRAFFENLSKYFVRDFQVFNTLYVGHRDVRIPVETDKIEKERITLRLNKNEYEALERVAFALGIRPTTACGVILDASMRDRNFVIYYEANFSKRK